MPNYVQMRRKTTNGVVPFQQVDDEMRQHINAPAGPDRWCEGW